MKFIPLLLLSVILALTATSCGGSLTMTELVVDESAIEDSYYVGDTVDFSAATFTVKLNDGSSRDVAYANVKVLLGKDLEDITENLSKITEIAGTKKVTFSYEGLTYEITVKVSPKIDDNPGAGTEDKATLSLVLDTANVTKTFEWGDTVAFTGLVATGVWSDDTADVTIPLTDLTFMLGTENITENLAKITASAGEKEITVAWTNDGTTYTAKFSVTVTDPIVSYSLENTPASYAYGDTPSFAAILMYSHAKSGQKALVSGDKKFFIGETEITANIAALTSVVGKRTVTVKVGNATKTFDVVVTNPLASISLSKSEIVFAKNATVDFSSVTVTATYADGTTAPVTEGVAYLLNNEAVDATLTATSGVKAVTVTYGGKTASLSVKVNKTKAELLDKITLSVTELTANYGEIDLSGVTVTAYYLANVDGTAAFTETVTADSVKIGSAPVTEATVGLNTVRYTFGGKTADLALTVNDVLESIEVTVADTFNFGDTFTFSAVAVYRSTARDTLLASDVTVTTADEKAVTAVVGTREITFTYGGKTAAKTVTVNDVFDYYVLNADAIEKNFTRGDDDLTFDGVVVTAVYKSTATAVVTEGITYHLGATDITENANAIAATFGTKVVSVKVNGETVGSITFEIAPSADDKTMTVSNLQGLNAKYFYKENVSLEGITFTVTFDVKSDDAESETETKNLSLADNDVTFTVNGDEAAITDDLGTSVIFISYTFEDVTYSATLGQTEVVRELDAITVTLSETVNYGDAITATVTAKYKNDVDDAEISNYTTSIDLAAVATTLGENTVTFTYEENGITKTVTKTVTVNDVLMSIQASIDAANKNYLPGATFDKSVITVTALYKSTAEVPVTDFTVSAPDMSASGSVQTVTVTYGGKTANVSIYIYKTKAEALSGIAVSVDSLSVALGGSLTFTVTATYSEGYESETLALSDLAFLLNGAEKAFADLTKTVVDNATVTVTYGGKEDTFALTVVPTELIVENISTTYGVTPETPVVKAVLTVGGEAVVVDATFDKAIANLIGTVGTHDITASYMGVDAVFTLTVNDVVTGVELPADTILWVDVGTTDTAFLSNLSVTVTYLSGARKTDRLSELVFSVTDWTPLCATLGNTAVTVCHKDKTDVKATFTLAVRDTIKEMTVTVGNDVWAENTAFELMHGSSITFGAFSFTVKYNRLAGEYAAPLADIRFFLGNNDITATPEALVQNTGNVTLTIQYTDDRGHVYTTTRTATVKQQQFTVMTYAVPDAVQQYNNAIKAANAAGDISNANTNEDGDAFESAFFKKDDYTYIVGDDNPYIFVPKMIVRGEGEDVSTSHEVYKFPTVTTVVAQIGNIEVTLDASAAVDGKEVTYTYGGKTYLTAFVNENKYQFTADAIDNIFTLSVMPASNFNYTGTAATHTFKVVDGYNVTTAKQLSILEQIANKNSIRASLWNSIKQSQGIGVDQTAASVIFHNNIKMTAADMPQYNESFGSENLVYTLPESEMNTLYDYASTNDYGKADKRLQMKSSTFLYDNVMILQHEGAGGIHGNFFSLDFSELPFVASFGNSMSGDYGFDFSNSCFLRVMSPTDQTSWHGDPTNWDITNNFFINNLDVNGNAAQSERVGPSNRSVNAGGVIFFQSEHSNVTWDNVKAKACFITYLTDYVTVADINNLKSYDTYCSTIFFCSGAKVNITNSNLERAGGPLLLLQQTKILEGHEPSTHIPVVTVDEASKLVNLVTGQESWFISTGASAQVATFRSANLIFQGFYAQTKESPFGALEKSILGGGDDNKTYLNFLALIMPNGGVEVLSDRNYALTLQASISIGSTNLFRATNNTDFLYNLEKPILNVSGANMVAVDPATKTPTNIAGSLIDYATFSGLIPELYSADKAVINMGAVGVVFGLFDQIPET